MISGRSTPALRHGLSYNPWVFHPVPVFVTLHACMVVSWSYLEELFLVLKLLMICSTWASEASAVVASSGANARAMHFTHRMMTMLLHRKTLIPSIYILV